MRTRLIHNTFGALLLGLLTLPATSRAEGPYVDHRPVWSRDGRSIFFMSNREDDDWEIYRIQLDGQGLKRLTHSPGWDGYASLSPDGTRLVFDSGRDNARNLVLLDLQSGKESILVRSDAFVGGGRWSPDGKLIAYTSEETGNRDLFLIGPDGEGRRQLTHTEIHEDGATFSPDGSRIVFTASLNKGSILEKGTGLYILDPATGERSEKLRSTGRIYGLDWSPNGDQIVFNTDEDGDQEIYLLDLSSGRKEQLTQNDFEDHLAIWSPDGKYLIYTSEREERERIYLRIMADGLTLRIITMP